jgi:hypothetical protein
MMSVQQMLTTKDNPYDPFTEYDHWYAFDADQGYNTPSYLARIVRTSEEMSEADQLEAIAQGIDEILEENVLGIYQKVVKEIGITEEAA